MENSIDQYLPEVLLELNPISTIVRLFLALLCGGILGVERGQKKRPAGFRTYMLVCMGSTLVMITNLYINSLYPGSDPARMGAQVISGIGFLGAGTIIVTGRNRVKGLTTAAGLWAAACVGLSIGVGFYSGAVLGCVLIFIIMAWLHRLDNFVTSKTKTINLYMEFRQMSEIGQFLTYAKGKEIRISDFEMVRANGIDVTDTGVLCTLHFKKKELHTEIIQMLSQLSYIRYVEEV